MVQWSRGLGAGRMKMSKLRAVCARCDFAIEAMPVRGTYRLIDLAIGHAVMNERRGTAAFSVAEALAFFRGLDPEAGEDLR